MGTWPSGLAIGLLFSSLPVTWMTCLPAAEPPVTAVAFTPDGTSVVSASQRGLTVWSWPELEERRRLPMSAPNPHDLEFSPDGTWLALGGGHPSESGMIEIISWPDGAERKIIEAHGDSVTAIRWRSQTRLASAGLDHRILLHDINSPSTAAILQGHSRGVTSLILLSDHKTLVSAGLDQSLRVWNVDSQEMLRSLNNHTQAVLSLCLRPATDGLPMVVSVSADRTVRLWQPTIGRMVRFVRLDVTPMEVRWLNDGSRIAVACSDGSVAMIDPDTVELTDRLPVVSGRAYSLAVHPADGSLVVGGSRGQLRRVDLKR